jgi:PAS domain S-box-containing protein
LNKALSEISYQSKADGIWLNYSFNPTIELEASCLEFEIEYTYLIDHVEIKATTMVHNAKGLIDGYLLLIPIIRKNKPQIIFTMRLGSKPDKHFIHTWEEVAEALWESMKKRHRAKKIHRLKLLHDTTSNQGKLGLFDWNIVTNQLSLSDGWKAQLGYKPNEINSAFETWESKLHPEDKDRAIKIIEDSLASKSSEYFLEHRLKHKQGHYVWIRSMATVFYDEEKQPIRMVGAHVDLTEVKQKESQLVFFKTR